jgi:hypothetical protein
MPDRENPSSTSLLQSADAFGPMFLSAEDFDRTGILAGVEPCASNYWWIPELHHTNTDLALQASRSFSSGPGGSEQGLHPTIGESTAVPVRPHAARRTSPRSTAA